MNAADQAHITHLKTVDISAWRKGTGDWFTIKLFDLMLKADWLNLAKLASIYPNEAIAFKWWRSGQNDNETED